MQDKRQLKADFLLLLVVTVWGSTFPIMKSILIEIDPFYFIALRFSVASLALLLVSGKRLRGIKRVSLRKGLILGVMLLGGYSFQIVGLQYTSASRSGFITGLAVVFVPLILIVFLKEFPGLYSWLGVGLAAAGLFMLTGVGGRAINYGDFLTLLCALSFALQIVFLGFYLKGETPAVLAFIQMVTVAGGSFLLTVFSGGFIIPGAAALGVIVYTGLLATAFAYATQSYAQQFTTPTHTGLIFAAEPVMAAVFAFFILGEKLGAAGLIGGILIITGMLLAEFRRKDKQTEAGLTDRV